MVIDTITVYASEKKLGIVGRRLGNYPCHYYTSTYQTWSSWLFLMKAHLLPFPGWPSSWPVVHPLKEYSTCVSLFACVRTVSRELNTYMYQPWAMTAVITTHQLTSLRHGGRALRMASRPLVTHRRPVCDWVCAKTNGSTDLLMTISHYSIPSSPNCILWHYIIYMNMSRTGSARGPLPLLLPLLLDGFLPLCLS